VNALPPSNKTRDSQSIDATFTPGNVDADRHADAAPAAMASLVGLLGAGDLERAAQGDFEERDSFP